MGYHRTRLNVKVRGNSQRCKSNGRPLVPTRREKQQQ